ncbi:N-alpha-acetyltransferase 30-like [Saccoglossus kowalevskii]|uniref:N-alpha-acetyltransferase 30-like n=1 Tax=Saccoglossus kowalevskii TaxID=10224 RepID=A0ABM0GQR1_SACKO|nr:PREDICTED: N-alpha-acetyltransferase 30-like [Saccoglossus kowalevskii]
MAELPISRNSEGNPILNEPLVVDKINGMGTEAAVYSSPMTLKSKMECSTKPKNASNTFINVSTEHHEQRLVNGCVFEKKHDHEVTSHNECTKENCYFPAVVGRGCENPRETVPSIELQDMKTNKLIQHDEENQLIPSMSRLAVVDDVASHDGSTHDINYLRYESELQMPDIMTLITKDLSEPYSIYTYRYFIHNWPDLCFLAMCGDICVGAIVCKLDVHKKMTKRGYIAMLAVDENYRRRKIGSSLVRKAIHAMLEGQCDEVVLETEITNKSALQLYENLGFVRDKRLFRYYLNGVDALRLKLWLR